MHLITKLLFLSDLSNSYDNYSFIYSPNNSVISSTLKPLIFEDEFDDYNIINDYNMMKIFSESDMSLHNKNVLKDNNAVEKYFMIGKNEMFEIRKNNFKKLKEMDFGKHQTQLTNFSKIKK